MDIYVTNPLKYSLWKQPTGVVAHTFDPRAQDVGACDFSEFKANLVNRARSRPAKAASWDPVSKNIYILN